MIKVDAVENVSRPIFGLDQYAEADGEAVGIAWRDSPGKREEGDIINDTGVDARRERPRGIDSGHSPARTVAGVGADCLHCTAVSSINASN